MAAGLEPRVRLCGGDGNRFHEIMKWNGLSEAAARRLRPGHPIRIKRSELR